MTGKSPDKPKFFSLESAAAGIKFSSLIIPAAVEKTFLFALGTGSFAAGIGIAVAPFVYGGGIETQHVGPTICLWPVAVAGGLYGGVKLWEKTFSTETPITRTMLEARQDWLDARNQRRGSW